MPGDGLWTIDELSAGVAEALAADYPGQSNGRVRDVPDRRTIRWYTTIGLLDRPVAMRGRTALYGRRHLLQLVAIKRLQASGSTLASVARELVGATGGTLEEIAALPADLTAPAGRTAEPPTRDRFWARPDVVPGVRLGAAVTLLLGGTTRQPDDAELAAIEAAAGPLLDTLRELGLDPALDHTGKDSS
jgi:hypothetical protein